MDGVIEQKRLEEWRQLGRKGRPSRLMEASELPQMYLKTDEEIAASQIPEEIGKRQQKQVIEYNYADLPERTLLKLIEQGRDIEDYMRKRKERKVKREQKLLRGEAPDSDSSDDDDDDEQPRKKRKIDGAASSHPASPAPAATPAPVKRDLKLMLMEILDRVIDSQDKS